jgi:hypothetical protein
MITTSRPHPPHAAASDRHNRANTASGARRALPSSRSQRRRTLAGVARPSGTPHATRPDWQCPATATAKLIAASALTTCPCRSANTSRFKKRVHARKLSVALTVFLLEGVQRPSRRPWVR